MKKSIINYSNTKIKNNLKRWFETAKEQDVLNGKNWYKEAQDFCEYLSKKYDLDTYTCATVLSCLSPNNRWERNKVDAEAVIVAHKNGIAPESIKVCTYTTNKLKAFIYLLYNHLIILSLDFYLLPRDSYQTKSLSAM